MIIESRINPTTLLLIDCESSGAIEKGEGDGEANPDRAIHNLRTTLSIVAAELSNGLNLPSDKSVEVEFAVKVAQSGLVAIGQRPEEGQFRVRIRISG